MEAAGLATPALRAVTTLPLVLFAPGLLILAFINPGRIRLINAVLYSVGLSVAFLFGLGLFIGVALPVLGIDRPFTQTVATATVSVAILSMCLVLWANPTRRFVLERSELVRALSAARSPIGLYLVLLPILSVVGALVFNDSGNSTVVLLVLVLVAGVPLVILFSKSVQSHIHPLAIVCVAAALLWHKSLVSQYLTGWDVHVEYYYLNLVLTQSAWNPTIPNPVNGMLSITVLGPLLSLTSGIDAVAIIKVVYTGLFSLVPVALYQMFRKTSPDKTAFLAVYFFVAIFIFYTEMIWLARQEIAELFFALFFLSLLDTDLGSKSARALMILFGFSIVISHYALSYLFLFYIAAAAVAVGFSNLNWTERLVDTFVRGRRGATSHNAHRMSNTNLRKNLSLSLVTLFTVSALGWYTYTTSGTPLSAVVRIADTVYSSLGEFLNPATKDPAVSLALGLSSPLSASVQSSIYAVIQWASELFIAVGLLGVSLRVVKTHRISTFEALILASGLLLATSVILPFLSKGLSVLRIYQVTLFFLAPQFVEGGTSVIRVVERLFRRHESTIRPAAMGLKVLTVAVLVPYLLFGTGVVYQVTGTLHTSIALDPTLDYPRFNIMEHSAASWMSAHFGDSRFVYGDEYASLLLYELRYDRTQTFWGEDQVLQQDSLILLRCKNTQSNLIFRAPTRVPSYAQFNSSTVYSNWISQLDVVYDSGCAKVYA